MRARKKGGGGGRRDRKRGRGRSTTIVEMKTVGRSEVTDTVRKIERFRKGLGGGGGSET